MRGLLVEVVVGESVRVGAAVGQQEPFDAVQHHEVRLVVENVEQLFFTLRGPQGPELLHRPAGDIAEGTQHEIVESGVGLVEAPPHSSG